MQISIHAAKNQRMPVEITVALPADLAITLFGFVDCGGIGLALSFDKIKLIGGAV